MIPETLELQTINLDVKKPKENILKHLNYYSFEERLFDLSEMIKESLNEEYTKVIQANTYEGLANRYEGDGPTKHSPIFNGVYKLAPFKEYMGNIPFDNQLEIKNKYQSLLDNPFLDQKFELVILAPLNNFAEENNIKAIDPICFAYFKGVKGFPNKTFLITLSQWV